MRRLSADSILMVNTSRSTLSSLRGKWPKRWVTRPPMVSKSSSGKPTSKYSLKSSMGVSALTIKPLSSNERILPSSSSMSVSSSISPTICSSTSSMVHFKSNISHGMLGDSRKYCIAYFTQKYTSKAQCAVHNQ